MSEEAWFKWLVVSFALHILVVAAFSITFKTKSKRIDLSSAYSVNLVGSVGKMGEGSGGPKPGPAAEVKKAPQKPVPVTKESKPVPVAKESKPAPTKSRPVPVKEAKNLRSLTKQKTPVKETAPTRQATSKEDLDRLKARIKNIQKKTEYLEVAKAGGGGGSGSGSGGGGLPFSGEGSGRLGDPLQQKYFLDIMDKIKSVWHVPTVAKKGLETAVVLKIRKDGLIVDIAVDKRSGNRIYDESVMRALKAAEPLPRIPAGLNTETIEIPLAFRPEDMS